MHNNFKFTFSGTSHSDLMTLKVVGKLKNLYINEDFIKNKVKARSSSFSFNTGRIEEDEFEISNIVNNKICENEILITVYNKNVRRKDYLSGVIRPSHVDVIGYNKYKNDYDFHGGGRHSGRLTVLYVIFGAILEYNLKDVHVYGQIKQVLDLIDDDITDDNLDKLDDVFPVINSDIKQSMISKIKDISKDGDSVGAKLNFRIDNLPTGLGGMYFDSFESILSKYLFGIGGVKSISFGLGLGYLNTLGSQANDSLYTIDNKIMARSNNQGGINGGYVNGFQPVLFSVIIRPTPTILKPQDTVRLNLDNEYENYKYSAVGRHDSFFANRVIQVIKACVYIALYEMEMYE